MSKSCLSRYGCSSFATVSEEHAILIHAEENCFSLSLAKLILSKRPEVPIEEAAVRRFKSKITNFDCIVFMPPPAPQYNGLDEDEAVARSTIFAFPAFQNEFRGGESWKDVYQYLFRSPHLGVFDWNRSPKPRLEIQLLDPWAGGWLKKSKKPGVIELDYALSLLAEIPPNITVRLRNNWENQVDVHRLKNGKFNFEGSESLQISKSKLASFLDDFVNFETGSQPPGIKEKKVANKKTTKAKNKKTANKKTVKKKKASKKRRK